MTFADYRKYSTLIIRMGLGLTFLANSYTAFVAPDEFEKLISGSFLASLLPVNPDLFIKFISVSDGVVATLFLVGKAQKYAAIYAFFWILGVMAVIGIQDPAGLLEHFGSLSMAVYLLLNGSPRSAKTTLL